MMQTDVKSAECAAGASTTAFNGPARAKAIAISHGATPGTVTIKDGTDGTTVFSYTTPAVAEGVYMLFPGEGIKCSATAYVTCPTGYSVTVVYGQDPGMAEERRQVREGWLECQGARLLQRNESGEAGVESPAAAPIGSDEQCEAADCAAAIRARGNK